MYTGTQTSWFIEIMDCFTKETQDWLDQRFRATDADGVYVGHQPIYGFRGGPSESCLVERYSITFQIMRALSQIRFQTFIDIGGAEGYKAALVRYLFGAVVRSSDLSREACQRSQEIFGVPGDVIDIHNLPYPDRAFDTVLCSETLEHVLRYREATRELMRIANNAVVITVPRESEDVVRKNIEEKVPHGHIHALDKTSFDFVKSEGWSVAVRGMNSGLLTVLRELVEARSRDYGQRSYPRFIYDAYNMALPLFRLILGNWAVKATVRLDDLLSNVTNSYQGMCFILQRDAAGLAPPIRHVSMTDILGFKVPHFRIAELNK